MQIIRPILIIAAVLLIIALSLAWVGAVVGIIFGFPFFEFLLPNVPFLTAIGISNVLIFIGVPLLSMIFSVLRAVFKTRISRYWVAGIWAFWLLNTISLFGLGTYMVKQFRMSTDSVKEANFQELDTDTLRITIGENPYRDAWMTIGDDLKIIDRQMISSQIVINLRKTDGKNFEIEQINHARGNNLTEARQLADGIQYVSPLEGNQLIVTPYFILPKETKWRNQKVILNIKVPNGKHIRFGEGVNRYIRDVEIDHDSEHPWIDDGQVWQMSATGLVMPGYVAPDHSSDAESRDFEGFSKLSIKGNMKVYIEQSDEFSVNVGGRDSYTEKVEINQSNDFLDVSGELSKTGSPVRLYIKMPALSIVDLENTDDVKISGFKEATMKISCNGNNEIKAYVDVENLSVNLEGTAKLTVRGNGNTLHTTLHERADLDAEFFTVKNSSLETTGVNHKIHLAVTDTLRRKLTGDVSIKVEGNPVTLGLE